MENDNNKTICAISTPLGNGGISIVRMSGSKSKEILQRVASVNVENLEPKKLQLTTIKTEHFSEQAMVVWFKAPSSYTGEDMVEIQCHGGIVIANGILDALIENGSHLAEAGEFTKRAFMNGKMSLDRAEGVIDMINAESEQAVKAGYNLLSGKLKEKVAKIQSALTDAQAQLEVAIDYPEEDIEYATTNEIKSQLNDALISIDELLKTTATGKIVKNGINVLILGKPNSGKSSLLNALLGYNRAIVTDIAGTTRDIVEDKFLYKNISFNITDTAGIRDADNIVERIGIERAEECIKSADIILMVLDGSKPIEEEDKKILSLVQDKTVLYVVNKIDLPKKLTNHFDQMMEVSALKQEKMNDLKEKIYNIVVDKNMLGSDILITSTRHEDALKRTKKSLVHALSGIELGNTLDLVATDVKSAWLALGEITGVTANQEIIDTIFSKFCLGK